MGLDLRRVIEDFEAYFRPLVDDSFPDLRRAPKLSLAQGPSEYRPSEFAGSRPGLRARAARPIGLSWGASVVGMGRVGAQRWRRRRWKA